MIERNHCKLCSRAKRAIGLCAVTPHRPADPFGRHTVADLIHLPRTVAVRNDAPIRHAVIEGVLPLLEIAGLMPEAAIRMRTSPSGRTRVGHLANHQHIPRQPLLFIPSCPHLKNSFLQGDLFECLGLRIFQDYKS
jgi:hypothetical protein